LGQNFIVPGADVVEEIELLNNVGLNAYTILHSATYNAAAILNIDDPAIITHNAKADLLVLNENPINDLRNPISAITNGKIFDTNPSEQTKIQGQKKQNTYATFG